MSAASPGKRFRTKAPQGRPQAAGSQVEEASSVLYGFKSLQERFGAIDGRQLQDKVFQTYQVADCPVVCGWEPQHSETPAE